MKIDICCIARNESLYIKEWLKHYYDLGINHIWIYDNNPHGDYSIFDDVKEFIAKGFVTVLTDYKDAKSFQMAAYNDFMSNDYEYDWAGFIDIDEYLWLDEKYYDIDDFFITFEKTCPNANCIGINWEMYGDNGHYFYEDKPLQERFTEPQKANEENVHIKSFVKKGSNLKFMHDPHHVEGDGIKFYNSDFINIEPSPYNRTYSYNNAKIKHFYTKSLEEFVRVKMKSNRASVYTKNHYYIEKYWARNEKTPEAENALKILKEKYEIISNQEKPN